MRIVTRYRLHCLNPLYWLFKKYEYMEYKCLCEYINRRFKIQSRNSSWSQLRYFSMRQHKCTYGKTWPITKIIIKIPYNVVE